MHERKPEADAISRRKMADSDSGCKINDFYDEIAQKVRFTGFYYETYLR